MKTLTRQINDLGFGVWQLPNKQMYCASRNTLFGPPVVISSTSLERLLEQAKKHSLPDVHLSDYDKE